MYSISKKKIASIYNEINQEIFSFGVHDQKIEIVGNSIIILARTKRVPALNALSGNHHDELIFALDSALSTRYKKRLKETFEQIFDINVTDLFRDYNPSTESSCTVICFDKPLGK
ncbi:Na-translocating system protein MpsC family protein [Niallia sp. 01092]|uniref:Na-translocating system protein MpsC family protein n=1 Tax=unclassified Niallia TaxID=2837522 RepID=UPI003FD4201F